MTKAWCPTPLCGGGGGEDLAATLAIGNDTGGFAIINAPVTGPATVERTATSVDDAAYATALATSGNGTADASITADARFGGNAAHADSFAETSGLGTASAAATATTEDNIANVDASATASGTGGALANRSAIAASGDVSATTTATTGVNGSAFADTYATGAGLGTASATTRVSSPTQADGTIYANDGMAVNANVTVYADAINAAANNNATTDDGVAQTELLAVATGTGSARSIVTATATGGAASIGAIADATSGRIMATGIPSGDPGVPGQIYQVAGALFISL